MIDLHCHTTASDGILTPASLIDRAVLSGVSLISVADHDCIDGIAEAAARAYECGIELIPCVEFSVAWKGGDFHLLGYGVDVMNPALISAFEKLRMIRENRIPLIVSRLAAAGVDIDLSEVESEAKKAIPGKPHVARVLIRKGFVRNFDEAFGVWLGDGKPGDVPKDKLSPEEAFDLIRCAKGTAVMAHPKSLNLPDSGSFETFLQKFIPMGLSGVEVYASMHSDDEVSFYLSAVRKYSLAATGGSDFHGDKDETLGCYGSGRIIPESSLTELRQRMEG
jgi:hypothetical protein